MLTRNLEINLRGKGKEHVKVITLRSGRELTVQGKPPVVREVETEEVDHTKPKYQRQGEQPQEKKSVERLDARKEIEKHVVTDEPSTLVLVSPRIPLIEILMITNQGY